MIKQQICFLIFDDQDQVRQIIFFISMENIYFDLVRLFFHLDEKHFDLVRLFFIEMKNIYLLYIHHSTRSTWYLSQNHQIDYYIITLMLY